MRAGRRQSKRTTKAEINVVPLLDVLLVLLLIFMATAPIINQSVQVDLPQANETEKVADTENIPVIVEVSDEGDYAILLKQTRLEHLPDTQIIDEVKLILKENSNTVFLIGGAKTVPYEDVIKALNLLQSAGVKSVGLMTQPLSD